MRMPVCSAQYPNRLIAITISITTITSPANAVMNSVQCIIPPVSSCQPLYSSFRTSLVSQTYFMAGVWLPECVSMSVHNQLSDWQVIFQTANAPGISGTVNARQIVCWPGLTHQPFPVPSCIKQIQLPGIRQTEKAWKLSCQRSATKDIPLRWRTSSPLFQRENSL